MEGLIKLTETGHFRGDSAVPSSKIADGSKYIKSNSLASIRGPLLLIDHMILCVAHCCEETDEVVQMLILNTLHMVLTSVCKVKIFRLF